MGKGPTPFVLDAAGDAIRHAPATVRNRDAISEVLRDILPVSGSVLEIASGTGEHIVHFAALFPNLCWQPSDFAFAGLNSIATWAGESGLPNILPPLQIDASSPDWPVGQVDAILCINMVHIAPWAAVEGLFNGARRHLPAEGLLYLYGPFLEADVPTAQSNLDFDANLKSRNPEWGLRDRDQICLAATETGFTLDRRIAMPANNISLVFRLQSI